MVVGYLALAGRIVTIGIDRILIKKLGVGVDTVSASLLFLGLGSLFLFPFIFFTDIRYYPYLWLTFITGVVYGANFLLYVKSLSIGEASLVSPLYNFNAFFLLFISSIFLDESITIYKILGTTILFYGISFLNRQKNMLLSLKAVFSDRACQLMVMSSLLNAVGRIFDGFIIRETPPLLYAFVGTATMSFYLIVYVVFTGRVKTVLRLFKWNPGLYLVTGLNGGFSYIFLLVAFSLIEISVVEPVSMLSMIITVILAKIFFKEEIRDRMIGVVIMVIGAWLLFV